MINKLSHKFIRITMLSVFVILLLIILAVNGINIYQNYQSVDSITELLLENGGSFRRMNGNYGENTFHQFNFSENNRFHNNRELPFSTRFFTVYLNADYEIINYKMDSIATVTEESIETIVTKIVSDNKDTGWYENFRYRFDEYQNGYMIVLVESSSIKNAVFSVFSITLIVGAVAFFSIFALVALFSKRAIRPIAETYNKQRQFITDASHELKTPLTVISANSEILNLIYGENEWCDGIEKQTKAMHSLINQMIQMSKMDEGDQALHFELFNISEAVYDTAKSFAALIETKGLHLCINVQPEIYLKGDEGSIRQVISILMDNAVKYCDDAGNIKVETQIIQKGIGRERVSVSIINSFAFFASYR